MSMMFWAFLVDMCTTQMAKVYTMEVFELTKDTMKELIPVEYDGLCGAFSEEALNELPNHGVYEN